MAVIHCSRNPSLLVFSSCEIVVLFRPSTLSKGPRLDSCKSDASTRDGWQEERNKQRVQHRSVVPKRGNDTGQDGSGTAAAESFQKCELTRLSLVHLENPATPAFGRCERSSWPVRMMQLFTERQCEVKSVARADLKPSCCELSTSVDRG